jgi:hypothetical protein
MPAAVAHYAPAPIEQKSALGDQSSEACDLQPIELSVRDRQVFFEAVLNPPAPNEILKDAARHYFERIQR